MKVRSGKEEALRVINIAINITWRHQYYSVLNQKFKKWPQQRETRLGPESPLEALPKIGHACPVP